MKRSLLGGLFATACALITVITAAPAAMADLSEPQIGVDFYGNGDAAQCGVNQDPQWAQAPMWTAPIRFDSDNRRGGCELSFGLRDPGVTRVPTLTYRWEPAGPSDPGQCGRPGLYTAPVNGGSEEYGYQFGPYIIVDTDNRYGFCNLTLTASGSPEYQVDVQFWADGDGQCFNTLPQGQWRSVRPGSPLTLSIDTDYRSGGCQMSLRLSRI